MVSAAIVNFQFSGTVTYGGTFRKREITSREMIMKSLRKIFALLSMATFIPVVYAEGPAIVASSINVRPAAGVIPQLNVYATTSSTLGANNPQSALRLGVTDTVKGDMFRWNIRKNFDLETGIPANNGSNFEILSFNDDGGHLGYPLTINRATGKVTLGAPTQAGSLSVVSGADPFGTIDDGSITLAGNLISTKACATGYKRIGPNFCLSTGVPVVVWTRGANSCTKSNALTGVTNAKAVMFEATLEMLSKNVVAQSVSYMQVYAETDATCAGPILRAPYASMMEFVAMTAGTVIGYNTQDIIAATNATGNLYTGWMSGGTHSLKAIGYYD